MSISFKMLIKELSFIMLLYKLINANTSQCDAMQSVLALQRTYHHTTWTGLSEPLVHMYSIQHTTKCPFLEDILQFLPW